LLKNTRVKKRNASILLFELILVNVSIQFFVKKVTIVTMLFKIQIKYSF